MTDIINVEEMMNIKHLPVSSVMVHLALESALGTQTVTLCVLSANFLILLTRLCSSVVEIPESLSTSPTQLGDTLICISRNKALVDNQS
jgi:hypothetical protein